MSGKSTNEVCEEETDWECITKINMGTGKRVFIASFSHQWLHLSKIFVERKEIGSPLCPMHNVS